MDRLQQEIEAYFPETPAPQENLPEPLVPGMFVQRQTRLPPPPEVASNPTLKAMWEKGEELDARARTLDRLGVGYPRR